MKMHQLSTIVPLSHNKFTSNKFTYISSFKNNENSKYISGNKSINHIYIFRPFNKRYVKYSSPQMVKN